MRLILSSLVVGLLGVMAAAAPAWAQAGGPELKTDDPYYPGEGALSTPPRVLSHAFAVPRGPLGSGTNREKMIRLFLWRAEHYGHGISPAVYNLPGVSPDPTADNPLMTDYDAMRALFSYGWGVCGTNHAQMRVFADELGWPCRRRGLQGDTGFEVQVDANTPAGATGWRYYNTDQYTLHFLANDPSAHFASIDEVISTNHRYAEWNPDLGLGYHLPQANTHGNYQDFGGVTGTVLDRSLQWRDYYQNVWNITPANAIPLYGEGYTSTPVVVHLKRGESFTRWADPSGAVTDLGLAGKLWWGYDLGGGDNSPFIQYSFVQNAPARDQVGPVGANPEASALVGQRYGNGCFLWVPDLSQSEHLDGTLAVTGTLTAGGSPSLKSSGASTLVLFHNAPYTIAARPSPSHVADPAQAGAADGAVIGADTVGSIGVEVSTNAGATWTSIGALSGTGAKIDFTDSVKGRNQYLLRLTFADGQGLNALSLRTVTMMNQAVYPNLKSGSSQVTYSSANTGALELSPDLWTATTANSGSGYVQKVADSGNVTGVFYGGGSTLAYTATDNNPLSVTYKITIPPQLASAGATFKQIFAAANAGVRVTPDGGPYTKIEISPNQTTWTLVGQYNPPADDQFSAYWAYGRSADGSSIGGTTYYVRFTTSNGPHQASLRYYRLSATYSVATSAAPVHVTYYWNNGSDQSLDHTVAAGSVSDSWTITTGAMVAQKKVVLSIPSGAATAAAPTITTQPANQTVTVGQTATFSVAATGTGPLSYQWQKNGSNIAGATASSYTTPVTTASDNNATFRVTVTNSAGTAVSNTALLTVNPAAGGPGPSTTVTLQQGLNGYSGTLDTYIDQFAPTSSFGNLDKMEVRYYDPGSGLQEHMISLLQFDLSSIPSTATVTSATLRLYNTRAASNGAGDVVNLDKVLSAWDGNLTWNMGIPTTTPSGVTCPSVAGYTEAPNPPELYTITGMDALVQGWVSTPASNLGMMLSTTSNLNIRFATSEYATAQYRPALEVTYTTGSGSSTPPTVTVNAPPSTATSTPIDVSGTAAAAGSATITSVTWLNAATGAHGTATGTTSWDASIPLATGSNTITITTTDSTGTSSSTTFTVTYTPSSPSSSSGSSGDGGGGNKNKLCGIAASEEPPATLPAAALAFAALVLWATRRRAGA